MSAFKLAFHTLMNERRMVEVWQGDLLIAAIYASDGPEVRVVSKHAMTVERDDKPGEPLALNIKIGVTS
jgi:hypothetical protein